MDTNDTFDRSRAFSEGVLRLLESARDDEDIAPAGIARAFGREVEFNRDDARIYGFGETLDPRWIANVVSLRDLDRDGAPNRLLVSFDDQTGAHDDWSAVCGLDFEAFASSLAVAGYTGTAMIGARDAFEGFRFRRGSIVVDLDVRGENAARPNHLCVARVLIDAREARHAHA
jgi:hypothetical protein